MELKFLGTGAGMPSKLRNTTAILMNLTAEKEGYWLFDCGEATQHQLLYTSLKPRKITKIFITHLHGDHIFGLPGLIGSRSFLGGEEPLIIYGPKGIKDWVHQTLAVTNTHLNYALSIVEIEEGLVFEDDRFKVYAKSLAHVIPCYGYRVEQKSLPGTLFIDKALAAGVPKGPLLQQLKNGLDVKLDDGTVVRSKEVTSERKQGFIVTILGDTSFCQASIELAQNAEIVVHEATFDNETGTLAKDYGHSTMVDAATVAKEAQAKALIATHISARFLPSDEGKLKKEGEAIFTPIFIANDFATFSIQNGRVEKRLHEN